MKLRIWFRNFATNQTITRSKQAIRFRPTFEVLEDRTVPTGVIPNDPQFPTQWSLNNTGQTGGLYDADIDAPAAWSITTGSMHTIVAVLDRGIDYTDPDLYLNIWLNTGEIPTSIAPNLSDIDGDGLLTFRDLNGAANASFVTDVNGNGYIDGGDLLRDARWANGLDEDSNGRFDDLIGWDFRDNDNDPQPSPGETHGTFQAERIGALTNNGLGTAGLNWQVRMIPIRISSNGLDIVNADGAAGIDYAVASGASLSNNSWRTAGGGYVYSQEIYDAVSRARQAGHLFVACAGNDLINNDGPSSFYPASYDLDNIISVAGMDEFGQLTTNYGLVSVDLGAAWQATSGASSDTTGVAALLKTLHPEWNYTQIKDRILSTVEPLASLAGKTVTGGRLNAAMALATTSISISDPTITEGDSGNLLVFTVKRVGDGTGSITLDWSTANGTATAGSDYVAAFGQISFLPSGSNTQTITINIKSDSVGEGAETFYVALTVNSGSAVLADEQGQGTILDPNTKYYVVDDATSKNTYEYASGGATVENYALNTGNTAPRGAASNAAGTTVWVVDANKSVYVYNTSGVLQGSWTAGGMNAQAQVEGIATNGTDIWLVDNKQDKVFRYTGAASRLSGSQNAASSFNLNSNNGNPSDLVTDGTSIWVVNDSSTDKVFKYTVAGSLLGSWTMSTSSASSPTGITLDPSNPQHLWIVDSGTDKVYQYDNAVSRTSGSQSASTTFALAAGNTNPQGIADPPPAGDAVAGPMPTVAGGPTNANSVASEVSVDDLWGSLVGPGETQAAESRFVRTPELTTYALPLADDARGFVSHSAPSMSAIDQVFVSDPHFWLDVPASLGTLPNGPLSGKK